MCSPKSIKHKILGRLNSTRRINSTLKRPSVEVLGGLVAFRPVPSVGEWVFCLLLLQDGDGLLLSLSDTSVGDGSEMGVGYFESVGGLNSGGCKAMSGSGLLDKEEVEECNKQDEGGERIDHES